jgi:acetyl-CoA carboxylase alpha subunit
LDNASDDPDISS